MQQSLLKCCLIIAAVTMHPQIDRVAGRELGIMLRVTYVTSFAHCLFVTLWQVLRLRRVHRSYVMQCVN